MTAALHTMKTPTTSAPAGAGWSARPRVSTPLPGPRSAELLARQEKRESNARTYPRHFPFAVAEASGSHIRDRFDFSRLLDLYALLNLPLHIWFAFPSSTQPDPQADPAVRVETSQWPVPPR